MSVSVVAPPRNQTKPLKRDVFKGFLLPGIWPAMSFVEAARGKSQRKFGGVARWRDQIGRSAAHGPDDGLEESLIFSPCARCVHREIKENLATTNVSSGELNAAEQIRTYGDTRPRARHGIRLVDSIGKAVGT
jgi:hypothetical protein